MRTLRIQLVAFRGRVMSKIIRAAVSSVVGTATAAPDGNGWW